MRTLKTLPFFLIALFWTASVWAQPMAGDYTVGGDSPDFLTLGSAISSLVGNGVSGPVDLLLRSGTYEEYNVLPPIPGASAASRITLRSETGIPDDVHIEYDADILYPNFILRVTGPHYTIRDLTIQNLAPGLAEYSMVINVWPGGSDLEIQNNVLIGSYFPTPFTVLGNTAVIRHTYSSSGPNVHDVRILDNEILAGHQGIYWFGSYSDPTTGLVIRGNEVRYSAVSFYTYYTDGMVVEDNIFAAQNTLAINAGPSLEANYLRGDFAIRRNHFYTPGTHGIKFTNVSGHGLLENNLIDGATIYGVYLYSSSGVSLVHNTIRMSGTYSTSATLNMRTGTDSTVLLNNILVNEGVGGIIWAQSPGMNLTSSNNNLFAGTGVFALAGPTLPDTVSTLGAWTADYGFDANSLVGDPLFEAGDWHLSAGSPAIDAGLPGLVADDLDRGLRDATPDIGADEYGSYRCDWTATITAAHCPAPDGTASLMAQGAMPPLTALWADGDTSLSRTAMLGGSYPVTVTDALGCAWTDTVVVPCSSPPSPMVISTYSNKATCYGTCDGSFTASVTGGCEPVSLFWFSPAGGWAPSTGLQTGLCASSAYRVRAIDACLDTVEVNVSVGQPPQLYGILEDKQNVYCHGEATGLIEVIAEGGEDPYSYAIGSPSFGPSGLFTGLTAANWTVAIRDGLGCVVQRNIRIKEPPLLNLNLVEVRTETVPGAMDGGIRVASTGGWNGRQYALDGGAFQVQPWFLGLTAGNYVVSVQDVLGCTDTLGVTVGPAARQGQVEARLYPNPTTGSVQLALPVLEQSVRLTVRAADGRLVWSGLRASGETTPWSFDVSHLPDGVYRVSWQAGAEAGARLLVVAR